MVSVTRHNLPVDRTAKLKHEGAIVDPPVKLVECQQRKMHFCVEYETTHRYPD